MNGVSVCLDEIALEGLDGITISTLWQRLYSATLWTTIDESYKAFLWSCVASCPDIQAYLLQEPRKELLDVTDDSEVYPYRCCNESGVRGSCSTFKTRKLIKISNLSLQKAVEEYGNKLVLVASQLLRNKVLFGPSFDISVKISDSCYCLLELIGRARKLGRLHSALGLHTASDNRLLFAQVKTLVKLQLITKQSVMARSYKRVVSVVPTSVVYLRRFHTEHTYNSVQYRVTKTLSEVSGHSLPLNVLSLKLEEEDKIVEEVVEGLFKSGHVKFVDNEESVDLAKEDHKHVKFVHHFYNLCIDDDHEIVDEEWIQPDYQALSLSIPAEVPVLHAVYDFVASKGKDGACLSQCCEELSMPFFKMRSFLATLESQQLLICKFEDMGSTRKNQYFARSIIAQSNPKVPAGQIDMSSGSQSAQSQDPAKVPEVQPPDLANLIEAQKPNEIKPAGPVCNSDASQTAKTSKTSKKRQAATTEKVSVDPEKASKIKKDRPLVSSKSTKNTTDKAQKFGTSWWEKFTNTERFLRRKKLILDCVENWKVVENKNVFQKLIKMEEDKIGYNKKVDKRTVSFLLDKLIADGFLKRMKLSFLAAGKVHNVELFCANSIEENHEKVVACLRKLKDEIVIAKAKENTVLVDDPNPKFNDRFLPKVLRSELLHVFLFYVVYELWNPRANLAAWRRKYDWTQNLKREHAVRCGGEGWFTPCAVLQLLPVSLFVKLVDSSHHNSTILQYFDNPSTRHALLKDLPPVARQIIYEKRKNEFLFASFEFLACSGLITPTNKQVFFHVRDIHCYLHTSTAVKDTRGCEPAYAQAKPCEGAVLPEKEFSFRGLDDVERYWKTVRSICVATPLNQRPNGRRNTIQKPPFKSNLESLIVDQSVVRSHGKPRGDGLGAAGFDSRLYCHLIRNWNPYSIKEKKEVDSDIEDSFDWQLCFTNDDLLDENIAGVSREARKRKNPDQAEAAKNKKRRKTSDVIEMEATASSKNLEKVKKKLKKRKKKKVEPKPKPKKGHWSKTIRDKRDEEAFKRAQIRKRNTFTPQQQKLLFICCLALRIVGKKSTDTGYIDWLWTRDVLYRDNYESAKTKTALSIRRKYCSMIKNAQTKTNLTICVADCMNEREFQPYCNLGKSCNEANFNELVELLKNKYSMENMVSKLLVLPSTMQEFREKNTSSASLDVEKQDGCDDDIPSLEPPETSIADIRQRIIRDAIVSALLLQNDSYESHVAFTFLSQFTEEELIIAISGLKNRGIVVRKELRYTKSHDLALCAFSQMLASGSRRVIENNFPPALINELKSFYDVMKSTSKSDIMVENDLKPALTLKFVEGSILGGHAYCILSFLACRRLAVSMKVPENFLALENAKIADFAPENTTEDQDRSINDETTGRREFSSANPSIYTCSSETKQDDTSQYRQEDSGVSAREERNSRSTMAQSSPAANAGVETGSTARRIGRERSDQALQSTSREIQGVCKSSCKEPRVIISGNVNRKRSNDMVLDVLCGIEDHLFGCLDVDCDSSLYRVQLQPTSTFTCTMATSDVDLARAHAEGDIHESALQKNKIYEDYFKKIETYRKTGDLNRIQFSVNPCKVQIRLLSGPEKTSTRRKENLAHSIGIHFKSRGRRMPTTIDEVINECSRTFGYSSNDCQALLAVYETINSGKEVGMSSSTVAKLVRRRHSLVSFSIGGLLQVLEAFNLVHRVGFVEVCYVTTEFKERWCATFCQGDVRYSSRIKKLEGEIDGKRKHNIFRHHGAHISSRNAEDSEKGGPVKNDERSSVEVFPKDSVTSPDQRTASCETIDEQTTKRNGSHVSSSEKQTTTETQSNDWSGKPSRPWIGMTGEINKNAYNTLHQSVLGYIVNYPGVQKYAVAKHYRNLVFPVAIDDILEKLVDSGCIEEHVCYVSTMTLFSSAERRKATYFLPKPDAMCKLMDLVLL